MVLTKSHPRARRALLAVASLLGAVACAYSVSGESPSDDSVYRARFTAMIAGRNVYDPLEAVPGATSPKPLPAATTRPIASSALLAAEAYADANASKALLVWRDGMVDAHYAGGANASTLLASKSLAKPLTAIVVGRAIRLGYIKSLDQRVSDFITEWRGGPKAAITIRYLLDMRSGLLGQSASTDPASILNRAYLDPRHDDILIRDYPLTHPPGARFDYSNAVADLVAIVIERATHERYAAFVSRSVLRPLGAAGGQVWIDRPGGLAHSACCILLPAETWLRLAILLLDDGRFHGSRFLPVGYVGEMKTPTAQNPYYGLGVYLGAPYVKRRGFGNPDTPGPLVLHGEPYLADDLFLFDGNADQVVYIVPSSHHERRSGTMRFFRT
jgi:CubicO group peptidase (beta-lactamase class C family)